MHHGHFVSLSSSISQSMYTREENLSTAAADVNRRTFKPRDRVKKLDTNTTAAAQQTEEEKKKTTTTMRKRIRTQPQHYADGYQGRRHKGFRLHLISADQRRRKRRKSLRDRLLLLNPPTVTRRNQQMSIVATCESTTYRSTLKTVVEKNKTSEGKISKSLGRHTHRPNRKGEKTCLGGAHSSSLSLLPSLSSLFPFISRVIFFFFSPLNK